jgi:hypothetical protein
MAISNQASLVVTIVFNIKHKMDTNLLVPGWWITSAIIKKGFIFIKLIHLEGDGILPVGSAILLVKFNGMIKVLGHFITIFVMGGSAEGLKLGLINLPEEMFLMLSKAFELFPTRFIKEIMVTGIDATGDRIILGNDGKRLQNNLPSFPFDHHIVVQAIIVRMIGGKGAFMTSDASKFPDDSVFIFILFIQIIKKLIV